MTILRSVFIIFLLIIISNAIIKADENYLKKGNFIIEADYGYPFIYNSVLKATYEKPGGQTKLQSLNQLAGKVEYMFSDKIGLGVESTFAANTIQYYDSNRMYTAGITKFRILAKTNFHFLEKGKTDLYFTLGIGYMNFKYYQTQSGINNLSHNEFIENIIPVAFRTGIGFRYFFTDYIGVNAEAGIGGPVLHAGITIKF